MTGFAHPVSPWALFSQAFIDMSPLIIGAIPFGLIVGALGVKVGLAPHELMLMSMSVYAGAAQFIALEMWGKAAGFAIIFTTLLVNLRHVLMGASVRPQISHLPRWIKVPFLCVMADENWATVIRRARTHGDLSPAYIAGASFPFYLNWQISCFVGTRIGNVMGDPARWGFDFVFTAVFATLVLSFWRVDRRTSPIIASAAAALVAHHWLSGSWYILIGGVVGVIAALLTFREESAL